VIFAALSVDFVSAGVHVCQKSTDELSEKNKENTEDRLVLTKKVGYGR
jgi:hypothetical protein